MTEKQALDLIVSKFRKKGYKVGTPESVIQSATISELESMGWYVVKLIQTNTNGIPDLMCLKAGKAFFIEVKRIGEKPTALQKYRHDQLRKIGFEVRVLSGNEVE
ncbi:MAG: VRR-NUC domain-containing protein [Niabella sp.]|nr:VRR-NUC domain-containing protein [Niabella sp.]